MGLILSCIARGRWDAPTRERIRASRRKHRVLLLKNALPVFVAASISRAILAIILQLSDGISSILAAFIYTFLLCHSVGATLASLLPQDLFMRHYFHSVITETVGFAWKESALLLVVDQIARHHTIGAGVGTWVAFTLFAICFVSATTLLAVRLTLSRAAERSMSMFTSEVFALSIAYTFTVIVAYLIYWQQRDDASVYATDDAAAEDEDDDDSPRSQYTPLSHIMFLCYAIALTYGMAIIQSYNEDKFSGADHSEALSSENSQPSLSGANGCVEEQSADEAVATVAAGADGDEVELANREDDFTSSGRVVAKYVTWDEYFNIHSALFHLLQTTQGYLVGSAWYLWITLTFEVLFSFSDYLTIFGYILFAVAMTYTMARIMSLSSFKLANLESTCNVSSRTFVRRQKRQHLKMAASRITVGWIWESVIAEVFIEIADIGRHELTDAVKLSVKCGVALLVFFGGLLAQYFFFENIHDDEENALIRRILSNGAGRRDDEQARR